MTTSPVIQRDKLLNDLQALAEYKIADYTVNELNRAYLALHFQLMKTMTLEQLEVAREMLLRQQKAASPPKSQDYPTLEDEEGFFNYMAS